MDSNTCGATWKDVEGFEGLYMVSDHGEVYSVRSSRILRVKHNNRGYVQVALHDAGSHHYFLLHRLVAQHFLPNPKDLPQVNHKDEDKENCALSNLEWCTNHYNALYGTRIERTSGNESYIESRSKMKRPVVGKSLDGKHEIFLDSIKSGSLLGFVRSGINQCCLGRLKTHKGYVWRYLDEAESLMFK